MQCCPWSSRQHYARKILFIVVLIPLEQHCTGQNPMQCCLRVYRQHTTGQNPVECCLNTPGTKLHRKNPQYCLRGSRQHCTRKNPVQCVLNTIWSLSSDFDFGLVNFLLISGCCKYHINIAQEKSWANIEQKDKLIRNNDIVQACWSLLIFLFYHDCSYFSCLSIIYHFFAILRSIHVVLSQYLWGIFPLVGFLQNFNIRKNLFF